MSDVLLQFQAFMQCLEMLEGAVYILIQPCIDPQDALIKLHDDNQIELLKANGKKIRQKYSQKEFEKRIHEVISNLEFYGKRR